MKIYRKLVLQWSEELGQYIKVYEDSYIYNGPIDHVCGATAAQNQILGQQTGFATQVAAQAGSIFGKASGVFNALQSTLLPTISKGPNQMGYSAGELASRQAGVITTGAQAAANAKSAIGNANAAQGGGNTGLTAGATTVEGANAAADIAQNTAAELNKVQAQGYDVGRQEYNEAIKGEEGSTEVFNPATSAANAGTSAFGEAAKTANEVAQNQNSWVNAAIGALGSVAGAATGGMLKMPGRTGGGASSPSGGDITPIGSGNYSPDDTSDSE
jgi:hypothetical protein